MSKCRKCGEEITGKGDYCNNCGQYRSMSTVVSFSSSISIMVTLIALLVFIGWASSNVIKPLLMYGSSRTWEERSCTVSSAKIQQYDDEYVLNILYSYEFEGKNYTSNRYSFIPLKSKNRGDLSHFLETYTEGTHTVCYVDPSFPGRAVLNRNLKSISFGFLEYGGLIIIIFLIVSLISNIQKSMKTKSVSDKDLKE